MTVAAPTPHATVTTPAAHATDAVYRLEALDHVQYPPWWPGQSESPVREHAANLAQEHAAWRAEVRDMWRSDKRSALRAEERAAWLAERANETTPGLQELVCDVCGDEAVWRLLGRHDAVAYVDAMAQRRRVTIGTMANEQLEHHQQQLGAHAEHNVQPIPDPGSAQHSNHAPVGGELPSLRSDGLQRQLERRVGWDVLDVPRCPRGLYQRLLSAHPPVPRPRPSPRYQGL